MIKKNKQNRKNTKATKVYTGLGRVVLIIEILNYPIKFNLSDTEKEFLKTIQKLDNISDNQLKWFENILSRGFSFSKLNRDYIVKFIKK